MSNKPLAWWEVAALFTAAWLMFGGSLPSIPGLPSWLPSISTKATAAVYVYEKDSGGVPPEITRAIGKLNDREIIAATHEDDGTNAVNSIPAQYRLAVPAARAAGLPAFVSMAGDKPLRTISKPTEAQVLEAVP